MEIQENMCEFCCKQFKSQRGLNAHLNKEIKCNQPLRCPKCNKADIFCVVDEVEKSYRTNSVKYTLDEDGMIEEAIDTLNYGDEEDSEVIEQEVDSYECDDCGTIGKAEYFQLMNEKNKVAIPKRDLKEFDEVL